MNQRIAQANGGQPPVMEDIASSLHRCAIIAVLQVSDPAVAVEVAGVLLREGIMCAELTYRASGTSEAIYAVRSQLPEMIVGAGTVLTREQSRCALDAGAQFVVSPGTNPLVVEYVMSRQVLMVPGVATPSEIEANLVRGLRTLKFFPAEVLGGTRWLTAVRGPFPTVRFIPTGGITADNLTEYLKLPNVLACAGTWIASRASIETGDLDRIRVEARNAAALVRARPE